MLDEIAIHVTAGNGGNGIVSFHREKFVVTGAPDGGNGGDGGDVILRCNDCLNGLLFFRRIRHFHAQNGCSGGRACRTGKSGQVLILDVPIGTQIYNQDNVLLYDFVRDGQEYMIARGGKGGAGNACLKSGTNRSPRFKFDGTAGESVTIYLKLKLLSHIGLIGLPNAGKSTLLTNLTAAKSKIADYPFTTTETVLGTVDYMGDKFVMADIPGLIQGAHAGRGLGNKFLQHIERCLLFIHVIDCTSNVVQDYLDIERELSLYSLKLSNAPRIICLNKCDLLCDNIISDKINTLQSVTSSQVIAISAINGLNTRRALAIILSLLYCRQSSCGKNITQ